MSTAIKFRLWTHSLLDSIVFGTEVYVNTHTHTHTITFSESQSLSRLRFFFVSFSGYLYILTQSSLLPIRSLSICAYKRYKSLCTRIFDITYVHNISLAYVCVCVCVCLLGDTSTHTHMLKIAVGHR